MKLEYFLSFFLTVLFKITQPIWFYINLKSNILALLGLMWAVADLGIWSSTSFLAQSRSFLNPTMASPEVFFFLNPGLNFIG